MRLVSCRRMPDATSIPVPAPAPPTKIPGATAVSTHRWSTHRWSTQRDAPAPMAAIEQFCVPESLVQQCQYFILLHLDEFPVSHLSLLPLHVRKELLWQMPLADVCQLEGTTFTDGLDMAAYWKYPFDEYEQVFERMPPGDEICYFHEWGATECGRAVLYGLLTAFAFGSEYLPDNTFHFRSSLMKDGELDGLTLLYAVRRPAASYGLKFPSRYSHLAVNPGRELTVEEVVKCFGRHEGELPKFFPGSLLSDDIDPDYAHFLSEVVCVYFVQCFPLEAGADSFDFIKAVIKGAANLETLILDQWGEDGCWISLDDLCDFLTSQTTFLSKFRHLKINSSNSCRFLGFTVSRTNFNQLITAYFAAPTDHVQKLEFTQTKIKSYDISENCSCPTVDQRYLQFKTIELCSLCQFVSEDGIDATPWPTTISNWLGQSISMLETPYTWQYLFKVDKETNANTRKRKHAEALLDGDCNNTDD